MVRLTCYGGVGEVGGNKILLETGGARIWLDFGTPFGRHKAFFNEYLRPRAARGLWDLLALGLTPPLEGLYRQDLTPAGTWDRFSPSRRLDPDEAPMLVLLSHGHLDHLGDIALMDVRVPVVTTPESAVIARALQVTGQPGFVQEWCYIAPRESREDGLLRPRKSTAYQGRPYRLLASKPVDEDLRSWWTTSPVVSRTLEGPDPEVFSPQEGVPEVRWWPVDHSIPGAAAFAVATDVGWVAYTGDLRFHGVQGDLSWRLMEDWARMGISVLVCEGTRLGDTSMGPTEADILENALALTKQAAGRLVVADCDARNMERLVTFLQVARETGRLLVVQPRDAYLLEALARVSPGFCSCLDDPCLALFDDVKSHPRPWERDVRERWRTRTVTARQVGQDPGAYILCCSLWDMNDLLDLPPSSVDGGLYLYANSKAYDEEQAVDLERLRQWVRSLGMRMEGDPDDPQAVPLHVSGHAYAAHLVALVREVRPRILIPVHTEHPSAWQSLLRDLDVEIKFPEEGRPMVLG